MLIWPEIDTEEMFSVINVYTQALDLLDDYDHQCVVKPEGNSTYSKLELSECFEIIAKMKFGNASDLFGTEKEEGKLDGILAAVYQTAFGQDVYPTLEEKAANLLYFLVKDHPFNDGCKRIAARPVSDLRNNFTAIEQLVSNGNPVYLTKNGYVTMPK